MWNLWWICYHLIILMIIPSDLLSSCGFFKIKKKLSKRGVVCLCDYATQWSFSLNLLILEILSSKKLLSLSCSLKQVMVISYTKVYIKMVRKKSNLFVNITVDKISLTLCAFLSLKKNSVTRYIFQFEKFKVSSFCLQRYATSWNIYWSTTNRELEQGRWPKTDC